MLKGRIRGIYLRGEIYWFGKMVKGRRSIVSLETRDYAEAVQRAREILERPELQPAQAFTAENMGALMKLVPASHILFGTDYNRFPISHSVKLFESLKLPNGVRRAIERDNAVTLLPRWKA